MAYGKGAHRPGRRRHSHLSLSRQPLCIILLLLLEIGESLAEYTEGRREVFNSVTRL